jgi:hypothetical protein
MCIRMDCITEIGPCCIYYDKGRYTIDKNYRDYFVSIIHSIFITYSDPVDLNIICGDEDYRFENKNRTIRIEFNPEHTLVEPGGRDSSGSILGNVMSTKNIPYLVRIDRFNELMKGDIVIDYSNTNICNVQHSGVYNYLANKMVYVSPSIYELHFTKENRHIDILTTFISTEQPRRANLISNLSGLPHINRNNCFGKEDLRELYKNTKILINIHQTDHHHTFEELRTLPALECGVIVISEISPLRNLIPYHDYIIWETYEGIVNRVKDVIENYNQYHERIFNTPKVVKLESLHDLNVERLRSQLVKFFPSNN